VSCKVHDVTKRGAENSAGTYAFLTIMLSVAALCQTANPTGSGTWSGGAQCEIQVQGPGYTHHETHTWTFNGAPSKQGVISVYAGTWSVTGAGSLQRTQGAQTLSAQWTMNAIQPSAPIAIFTRASDRKLIIKSWHAQLRTKGGVTGTQRVAINGVEQTPRGVISLEAFEWSFPAVEDAASATSINGSSTKATNGSVGPMQPGGSQGTSKCTWHFAKGATASTSAIP
jgi:hypothetical protein